MSPCSPCRPRPTARLAVVVADGDEVRRLGWLAALRERGWQVVDATVPDEGEESAVGLGLVVVDRADHGWDRYAAVEQARRIRGRLGPEGRLVAVAGTARWPLPVLLASRLAAVGVNEVVPAERVTTTEQLLALLSGADPGAPPDASERALRRIDVGPATDPEAVLAYVASEGLVDAFSGGRPLTTLDLPRRRVARVRADIARLARLDTAVGRATGGPARRLLGPTWREVCAYVDRARGAIDEPS